MPAKFLRGADPRIIELAKEAKRMFDEGKTSCCDVYVRIVRGDIDQHFFRSASMNNREVEDRIECNPGGWFFVYTIDRDGDYISEPFRAGLPKVSDNVKFKLKKTSGGYVHEEIETGGK